MTWCMAPGASNRGCLGMRGFSRLSPHRSSCFRTYVPFLWFTQFSQLRKLAGLDIVRVQSGQFAGQARISKCGRGLLRWALYQAALGAARTVAGRARLAALKTKRHGDRYAGFKATVELAAKLLRVVWGVWRSGTPYDPRRAGGLRRQPC